MRVLQVGLGPLGRLIARDVHTRGLGSVVAAVDIDPAVAGKPLADLVPEATGGCTIADSLDGIGPDTVDIVIVTTASSLEACAPTFRELLSRGLSVVSTCEELLYPRLRHPGLADELDALARTHDGRLLGTGVNPGLLMDTLPAIASAACRSVRRVDVWRIQDATTRRVPFQRKIGAALSREAFDMKASGGSLRHVGLGESLHFLADALGWTVERWEESLTAVLSETSLACAIGDIPAGGIAGVRQVATGVVGGEERLRLEFVAAIGQADPHDRVRIEGDPDLDLTVRGGVHGDTATIAMTLNVIEPLLAARPGLHTMQTVGLPSCRYHA